MRSLRRFHAVLFVAAATFPLIISTAQASSELRKTAIVSTLTEAALATTALVRDRIGHDADKFAWSARYSGREWSFRGSGVFGGKEVTLHMSGYVWGDEGENLVLVYSGGGVSGEEPILIHGKADWLYDAQRKDFFTTDFRHVMKLGKNSFWGRVSCSEILVGGIIGAGGALAATGIATGGAALVAAFFIGSSGFIGGSAALVSLSDKVQSLTEDTKENASVPALALPERPILPGKGERLGPRKGMIVVGVSKDGKITGSVDVTGTVRGDFDNKNGVAHGIIFRAKKK